MCNKFRRGVLGKMKQNRKGNQTLSFHTCLRRGKRYSLYTDTEVKKSAYDRKCQNVVRVIIYNL